LYQHSLELKTAGPNAANPGVQFITGNIEIATDDELLNIVPVHFTYVTPITKKGTESGNFTILLNIINGVIGSVMGNGADKAGKLRIDSAIGLNDFYDRNDELVSVKRNEGGFIHTTGPFNDDTALNSRFECDMLITNVIHVDANEDTGAPEKAILKGAIFDFRKAILPVEFSVLKPGAIAYFEGAEISDENPMFTKVKGSQVSETVVRRIEEESAFGEPSVREVKTTRKDFVVDWAAKEPYLWDDESSITAAELDKLKGDRELMLATLKSRRDEYKASRAQASASASSTPVTPVAEGFKF
jgi:hypothetical protein